MKKSFICIVMVAVLMSTVYAAYAGTEDDAKALARRVASYLKENGKDKGVAEIMDPADRFKRGKFNVSVNDFNGVNLANVLFPTLVGQNHYTLKDADGKSFVKDAIAIAKTKGEGWLTLAFTNPDTKKIGKSNNYVLRVEGADMYVMTSFPMEK